MKERIGAGAFWYLVFLYAAVFFYDRFFQAGKLECFFPGAACFFVPVPLGFDDGPVECVNKYINAFSGFLENGKVFDHIGAVLILQYAYFVVLRRDAEQIHSLLKVRDGILVFG